MASTGATPVSCAAGASVLPASIMIVVSSQESALTALSLSLMRLGLPAPSCGGAFGKEHALLCMLRSRAAMRFSQQQWGCGGIATMWRDQSVALSSSLVKVTSDGQVLSPGSHNAKLANGEPSLQTRPGP